MKTNLIHNKEFEQILSLVQNARNRIFSKANTELILLYFNVGKIVSEKVNNGNWGDNTVQELADFIAAKQPELNGFNRRGLYRMKQYYETYTNPQFVSTASTLLQTTENETTEFVTTLLTQIQWSAHLHILSKTKTTEEKIFYLKLTHDQNLSVRELERQLNTSVYERTMLSNTLTERKPNHLPQNIF